MYTYMYVCIYSWHKAVVVITAKAHCFKIILDQTVH